MLQRHIYFGCYVRIEPTSRRFTISTGNQQPNSTAWMARLELAIYWLTVNCFTIKLHPHRVQIKLNYFFKERFKTKNPDSFRIWVFLFYYFWSTHNRHRKPRQTIMFICCNGVNMYISCSHFIFCITKYVKIFVFW